MCTNLPPELLIDLMTRAAAGDDTAFAQLHGALARGVHRLTRRLCTSSNDVDDVCQNVFLKLWCARGTYVPGKAVLPWVHAITRNACADAARARLRRERSAPVADLDRIAREEPWRGAEAELCGKEAQRIVRRELDRMSARIRDAYVLVEEQEVDLPDAAAALGARPDAMWQRLHRARTQIRAALVKDGWNEPVAAPRGVTRA